MNKVIVAAMMMVALLFSTAACGNDDAQTADKPAATHSSVQSGAPSVAPQVNESDVVKSLHLKKDQYGSYIYKASDGTKCEIAVVMTDAASVNMYAEAGDNVASNQAGTVGVKIVSPEAATCQAEVGMALSDFK